jgi:tripartite-type tricarboxylate transporter receptor subunit TctC
MRFLLLRMLAGLLLFENLVFPSQAATDFPDRPVRILVGFAPGGTTDLLARIIADELRTIWNTAVVVENRPGADGIVVTTAVHNGRRTATRF